MTTEAGEAVTALLALRRKATTDEFRRQCEECKRLAEDATPMTAGEREREERNVGLRGNSAKPHPAS